MRSPIGWPGFHNPTHSEAEYTVRALSWLVDVTNRIILPAIEELQERQIEIMTKMDDFKAQFAAFTTKLDAFIAAANANQANSDVLVAAALKAQQDGQDVDIQQLSDDLAAEAAKVPDAPVTPPAPPTV